MKKLAAPTLALLASAAVVLVAACSSTSDGPVSPASARAPLAPLTSTGIASPSSVQVCVSASSPAGSYTFSTSSADIFSATAAAPSVLVGGDPALRCTPVMTRSLSATDANYLTQGNVTVTATAPLNGTYSFTCVDNVTSPAGILCGAASGSGNTATASLSGPHGSVITFSFVADAPPSVIATPVFVIGNDELRSIGTNVNFWGAQWWKNNFMTGLVSNGVASFKGYASSADNFCGGTWTSRPGNSSNPPATITGPINIIVTSTVNKSGPNISGDIVEILTINSPDAGYEGNPGHAGTGNVSAVACTLAP